MIISYLLLAFIGAFALVYLFEKAWGNRPPALGVQWPKGRAMRFLWAGAGVLVVLGQIPLGIMAVIAGLPVCLAHLRLVDQQPAARIHVGDVFNAICQTARTSFRRFIDRTRIDPRR